MTLCQWPAHAYTISCGANASHPSKLPQQDMGQLEKQVAELGEARPALEADVAAAVASGDYEAVQAASQRLAALTDDLRQKEDRWLDLADRDE
jgi:ABC transporter C-terminal domain